MADGKGETTDAGRFMRAVMDRVGATNPTELSKALGGSWTERDQQRKLYRWWGGEAAPNFASTMQLVQAAGWLTEDGVTAAAPAVSPTTESDRLGSLEAVVDEQGRATTEALQSLTKEIQKLRRQLTRGVPRAKAAGQ